MILKKRKKLILMSNPLDPSTIPKYVNKLKKPAVFKPAIVKDPKTGKVTSHNYTVTVSEFKEQILPPTFPKTRVYGYEGVVKSTCRGKHTCYRSAPGATFEAVRGIPANVQWINNLTKPNILAVDPTLHWANPNNMPTPLPPFKPYPKGYRLAQSTVPIVSHLHGGEVRSDSDGDPTSWFTAGEEKTGEGYSKSRYTYLNTQNPTTLWYHEHALGTTRLGIYAGLAGFYLLRDPKNPISPLLPSGNYEIPMVIQDRSFYDDGSLLFPSNGQNPEVHPYWRSAFIGNTIMVNGKVWPNLDVERRQYRFRILNGSNTRTYNLKLSNGQSFIQIGSDGGFLPHPVELTEVLVSPAERVDILIDFSQIAPCTKIIMTNDANAPYPNGGTPDPDTVGQIMQFSVLDSPQVLPDDLPSTLNHIPMLTPDVPKRIVTLNVVRGAGGSLEILLDGQKWSSPISELPIVGSTQVWEIVNLTNGAHPIHIHLIQFLVKNNQDFDSTSYRNAWEALNGNPPLQHPTIPLPVEPYTTAPACDPSPNLQGWKDTIFALPGKVTRITVRMAPQDAKPSKTCKGVNLFPFDPTVGPGYVWHCHLVDHEDNEMMRPMKVIDNPKAEPNPQTCCQIMVEKSTQLIPPALVTYPVVNENKLFAKIESVCGGQIVISGFIRRTISYTGITEYGIKEKSTVVDDASFQCMIERDDANEGDSFRITGKDISCKVFAQTQNYENDCETKLKAAGEYVEKDIVKICVRKDC